MKLNLFVYRPDRLQSDINPDLCYTSKGQSYAEWKRDEQTAYNFKVEKIKDKFNEIPQHKCFDWWRNE